MLRATVDAVGHVDREPRTVAAGGYGTGDAQLGIALPVRVDLIAVTRGPLHHLFVLRLPTGTRRLAFGWSAHRLVQSGQRRLRGHDRPAVDQCDGVIDRNGESKSFADLLRDSHRVDADHGAVAIDQRSAAVAWIDRRVGLNERNAAGLTQRADDAARHRIRERAEGVSDGDDFLAWPRGCRRAKAQRGLLWVRVVHLEQREIDRGRSRHDTRRVLRASGTKRH